MFLLLIQKKSLHYHILRMNLVVKLYNNEVYA